MYINAIFEIPKGETRRFTQQTRNSRIIIKDYARPFVANYGYIIGIKGDDGDELDVYDFGPKKERIRTYKLKPSGIIYTLEDNVVDNKILTGNPTSEQITTLLAILLSSPNRVVSRIGGADDAVKEIKKLMEAK